MRRSRGIRMRDLFSSPATMRSTASVKSSIAIACAPRRVASTAASFARLARSAPVKPGVSAAMSSSSTSGASFSFFRWMRRMSHAALLVRPVDQHLPVEPAGAQQRGIQDLRPVGRRQDDDGHRAVEAVHLGQQLVERLLLLVLPGDRVDAARPPQRIQFVDEDDAGRGFRAPARTGRAPVRRRRRRTSRRTRRRWWSRTARPPRRPPRAPAASCRCRAVRPAGCRAGCARRAG